MNAHEVLQIACKRYHAWREQGHKYALASMKETSLAGIVGNAAYADGFNSIDIIARMN